MRGVILTPLRIRMMFFSRRSGLVFGLFNGIGSYYTGSRRKHSTTDYTQDDAASTATAVRLVGDFGELEAVYNRMKKQFDYIPTAMSERSLLDTCLEPKPSLLVERLSCIVAAGAAGLLLKPDLSNAKEIFQLIQKKILVPYALLLLRKREDRRRCPFCFKPMVTKAGRRCPCTPDDVDHTYCASHDVHLRPPPWSQGGDGNLNVPPAPTADQVAAAKKDAKLARAQAKVAQFDVLGQLVAVMNTKKRKLNAPQNTVLRDAANFHSDKDRTKPRKWRAADAEAHAVRLVAVMEEVEDRRRRGGTGK